jgi:hypothetical protein
MGDELDHFGFADPVGFGISDVIFQGIIEDSFAD